ncbi:retrotransposon protein, putative, ty3-gypsy subclass, partial [Tanacetum coccineum]
MTWDQLVSRFLDYFFPVGRTSVLRDLILRFKQGDDEPIKSAWIRFQDLIKQVPYHGIQKWLLVQIFYDSISHDDRRKLDQFVQFCFKTPEPKALTFIITTRSGISTQDPPFPAPLKKQKKDDEDEWLLSIFKQIHINLPFLEAMIHMPKGAKVLKNLLSHKEKLEKAAYSVKHSEKCSAIFQRSLSQKEEDPGSFTLPCLIGTLTVKNALADLGASINLMPHSLFRRLGISKLKPTKMILEIDEDEPIPIILGRPFLATARSIIDVHEGKLSLRVKIETVTFNIGKSMKSKHSRDDYLYCANHTFKLVQEQWVNIVNHDGEWTKEEEGDDPNKVLAASFYPRTEPVEPLEWKAPENRLKPSSMEPPKLELKELPKHLEYAFLQENNQLPVVISFTLSIVKKI